MKNTRRAVFHLCVCACLCVWCVHIRVCPGTSSCICMWSSMINFGCHSSEAGHLFLWNSLSLACSSLNRIGSMARDSQDPPRLTAFSRLQCWDDKFHNYTQLLDMGSRIPTQFLVPCINKSFAKWVISIAPTCPFKTHCWLSFLNNLNVSCCWCSVGIYFYTLYRWLVHGIISFELQKICNLKHPQIYVFVFVSYVLLTFVHPSVPRHPLLSF